MPQILDNTPLLLFKKYILRLLCAQEKCLWGRGGKGTPHRVNPALYLKKQEGSCPAKERWEAALWTRTVYVSGNYFHADTGVPSASWGCLQESSTLPDYHSPWGGSTRASAFQDVSQKCLRSVPSRICPWSVPGESAAPLGASLFIRSPFHPG